MRFIPLEKEREKFKKENFHFYSHIKTENFYIISHSNIFFYLLLKDKKFKHK